MSTATEHRAKANEHFRNADESFERSDTDGFVTQWASNMSGQLEMAKARLAEAGGVHEFPALFDLDGNRVPAKYLPAARYGPVFALVGDDGDFTGFVSATYKRDSTVESKGYRYGREMAPAVARTWAPAGARGLSGATSVQVVVDRADNGLGDDPRVEVTHVNPLSK